MAWLLAVWFVGCAVATEAGAQNVFRNFVPELAGNFIEPPRAIRQELELAEKAIAEERYSEAVLGLGKLLQRASDVQRGDETDAQDFFLDAGQENLDAIAVESLLRRAETLLGTLPEKGLEVYELNYGPAAQKALEAATDGQDPAALKEVIRRYFHTQAGYQAAYLWAYHQLQSGRPLAASILLQRLAAQPRAARQMGVQLDVALALALKLTQRSEAQVQAALQPAEDAPAGSVAVVRLADSQVPVPEIGEETAWFDQHFGSLQRAAPPVPQSYPVAGGDPSRSLSEGGQQPLSDLRWKLETTAAASETVRLQDTMQSLASQGELPPPTWLPLLVGDQLLMRTTERLMGVDFETGKRVWEYPWSSSTEAQPAVPYSMQVDSEDNLLHQRVWYDLPYGRMSSDGQRVYLLDDLAEVERNRRYTPFGVRAIQRGIDERQNGAANTLVALELASEGKLLWRLGVGEETPSVFTDAFFLGPPLPIDGRLYVVAELAGDVYLLCLDPATGGELWRQQLLAIEVGNIETDIVRRVSGAMPAYQDGVLVCPTGAGALVAIDLASRSLLWGMKYPRSSELDGLGTGRSGPDPTRLMQRWHDSTPIIHQGAVYVTPIESDRLYGFDLVTGKPLFPEIVRSNLRYLAGVRDDQLIVVGSHEVHAYDRLTGRQQWTTLVNEEAQNAQVCGTGVFGGDLFFVPLSNRQIIAVNVTSGKIVSRQDMDFSLGNLVQAGGQLISQSPTEVAVAYGQQWLRPTVEARLAADPQDPWAIKRKAQLLIEDGKRDEALQWLPRALELDPEDEEARTLYVSAMLGALRDDFDAHVGLLPRLEQLVQFPQRRAELLALMARGSLQNEQPLDAQGYLSELSALVASANSWMSEIQPLRSRDAAARPSLDQWIAGQSQQVYAAANPQQRQQLDRDIAAHLQRWQALPTRTLKRLSEHFADAAGADATTALAIQRFMDEGSLLAAERMALAAIDQTGEDASRAAPFRLLLARIYDQVGFTADVRAQLAALLGDAAPSPRPEAAPVATADSVATAVPGLNESQRQTLTDLIAGLPAAEPAKWPPYVVTNWNTPQGQRLRATPVPDVLEILARRGRHLQGWQVISESGRTISLRDPYGHVSSIPMSLPDARNEGTRSALIDGGILVAVMPSELVAVDLLRAAGGGRDVTLWRHPWRSELGGRMARARSVATPFGDNHKTYDIVDPLRRSPPGEFRVGPVDGSRLYILNGAELQALEVTTGEQRWTTSAAPPRGHVVAGDGRVAVASPAVGSGRVDIFSSVDGRRLDSRPWPEKESIWFACGRHLLTYEVAEGNVPTVVRLRDVFEDRVVLSYPLETPEDPSASVKGHIAEARWLSLLQPGGQVVLWDLREGREVGTHQLQPIEKLNGLQSVVRDNAIILLPETSQRAEREPNTIPNIAQSRVHYRVDGPVLCMDLNDGKIRWETALEDGPWGCTIAQATGSPLLIFSRALTIHSMTASRSREQKLSMMALDIETGQQVVKRSGLKLPSFNSSIVTDLNIDPEKQMIAAMVGASFMQFAFTDQKPPSASEPDETAPDEKDAGENNADGKPEDDESEAAQDAPGPFGSVPPMAEDGAGEDGEDGAGEDEGGIEEIFGQAPSEDKAEDDAEADQPDPFDIFGP